ncbi:MAG: YdbL family protein [Pseudomonadota bacterium]
MRKITHFGFILLFLLLSPQIWALSLDQAKSQGLVGEKPDGYLGAVKTTPDVKRLISDINGKRKSAYQKIAKQKNVSLKEVEKLGGQKAINKTAKGNFIWRGGKWIKK